MSKLRTCGVIVLGALATIIIIAGFEMLSMVLKPPPADLNFEDAAKVKAWLESLPFWAWAYLWGTYFVATFVGAWVAVRLSTGRRLWPAWLLGSLFTVGTLGNLMSLPHPLWFAVANLLEFLPAAWCGGRLAQLARPTVPVSSPREG